jgi:hypothetical protein
VSRCGRNLLITKTPADGTTAGVRVQVPANAVGFTLRVTDAAGAVATGPVWSLTTDPGTGAQFHFAAAEAYSAEQLKLDEPLYLRVLAANGSLVELLAWTA